MQERKLTEGCPIKAIYGPYHVRYCVKASQFESWLTQEYYGQTECFPTKEQRQQWIDWHKENTKLFEVLRIWDITPPREKTQQEKDAEQERVRRYNAEREARYRKQASRLYFATRKKK